MGELHRSPEGRLEDLREAGAGGVWLELRAEEGWEVCTRLRTRDIENGS